MLIWVICLLGFSSRELAVPDISMVHGRMLVCAWETGLEEVSDTAVKLIMQSIEVGLVMGWGKRGGGEPDVSVVYSLNVGMCLEDIS